MPPVAVSSSASSAILLPGDSLPVNPNASTRLIPRHAGTGTHLHASQLCSSIGGTLAHAPAGQNKEPLPCISPSFPRAHLPRVNSLVLGRITRINPRQASVAILIVDGTCLSPTPSLVPAGPAAGSSAGVAPQEPFQGAIRVQDVRATEKDKVLMAESFRPGDVIRALVISLGDQTNYYLTTARNDLGVVLATSEAGNAMVPISWREFGDPVSGARERRKVAKPE